MGGQTQISITEECIRERAYEIYIERGGADGRALDDWLQAEIELTKTKKEEVDARGFKHIGRDFRDRDPGCLGRRSGAPHPPFEDSLFNVESPGACFRKRSASEEAREQSCHTSWKAKAGTRKNAGVSRE
jgi:Protein of unknown function (DUF2934)